MSDSTGNSAEASSIAKNIQQIFVRHKPKTVINKMKPVVADEMFPEGIDIEESGNSGIMLDLAASEKDVHADFYNDFDDLFDEDDL